jgi:hypothetical protein
MKIKERKEKKIKKWCLQQTMPPSTTHAALKEIRCHNSSNNMMVGGFWPWDTPHMPLEGCECLPHVCERALHLLVIFFYI